jgi:hypothetical protein
MTAFPYDSLVSLALRSTDAPASPHPRIGAADIVSASAYERVRLRYYRLISELRTQRRARLAPHVVILFENRETVLFQIHEILRVEGHTPAHIERELETYACLLPPRGELRATVMIDGGTPEDGRSLARALRHRDAVTLTSSGRSCGSTLASPDDDADDAVQYLRFRPEPAFVSELRRRAAPLGLAFRHEGRKLSTFAHSRLRAQLRSDLGPPAPRSLLHTLVACPWLLNPTETESPWPF